MTIDYFPGIDAPEPVANDSRPGVKKDFFGEDGFNFFDLLDIINPLQHIPILSGLYRKITGDEISPGARMMGGGAGTTRRCWLEGLGCRGIGSSGGCGGCARPRRSCR